MVPRLQTPQRRRRTSGLARSFMAESRGPEPHTFRCHRCSKPCRRACPVDSPKWRTAEALIPSAEAPTRFPIEAGGAPVHCPDRGVTAGLHRNASRASICFQGSAGTLVRFVIQGIKFGHHDRTRTYILDLRRVVLIQLSYVVMVRRRQQLAAGAVTSRARRPSTDSRARSRAESSAGTDAGRP